MLQLLHPKPWTLTLDPETLNRSPGAAEMRIYRGRSILRSVSHERCTLCVVLCRFKSVSLHLCLHTHWCVYIYIYVSVSISVSSTAASAFLSLSLALSRYLSIYTHTHTDIGINI